jgi:hypothetical protein
MDGFNMTSYSYIYDGGGPEWKIMDTGDYDGDGKPDILWRQSVTGQTVMYLMDGPSVKAWTIIFQGDPNWSIIK